VAVTNTHSITSYRNSHDHFLTVIIENLTKLGNEINEICNYIELNMTAIRKILKKFDKQFTNYSM
jgi:SPX domain protein involved in polyphosphate accumulation